MHKIFVTLLFTGFLSQLFAQELTYYEDIEKIIINNCASCHKKNGYGPFPLTTYEEVKKKGTFIAHVTKIKYMPPWKADPEYRTFKNQRVLKKEEIEKINEWVSQGMKEGKKVGERPKIPDLLNNRKPDLVLEMKDSYIISNEGIEDYRFFNLPTNLKEDKYIESIEYVPGNKRQVHHSRIMADTTNQIRGINGLSEYDPKVLEFQKKPLADEFLYGWVPGNLPILYPEGTGKKMYADTDLLLNIHYAPASVTQTDKSKIKLYFSKKNVEHEIKVLAIRENHIANQPFFLRKETKPTFYVKYRINNDMNIVSIMPHMHYLGQSFESLALTPDGLEIPLIKINKWDFNWQSTYLYEEPLFIPKGSIILVSATYDNTSGNPSNPNFPAKNVGYGWNSTDEMMNLVFYYF
ncbi:hypothetical protein [Maribacter cobaltidurans]|uniref:Uncharacterized protein n=1 Tax=Maribacter cobaltidurans TaxID=1178778 RepID=A0A223V1V8_9FLAO|nr:hypothetical protein [Maribacter cobaltidurans]ASV29393.1 hypothetical protein CJ263_03660 [Maribacter cobaltidurans]GGD69493.1 hypothetical protein GCM10011412_03780 [Maribacter cobaltidurans]